MQATGKLTGNCRRKFGVLVFYRLHAVLAQGRGLFERCQAGARVSGGGARMVFGAISADWAR
jgi:hypothetical protein